MAVYPWSSSRPCSPIGCYHQDVIPWLIFERWIEMIGAVKLGNSLETCVEGDSLVP